MTPDHEETDWLGFTPNCRQCLVQLEAVDDPSVVRHERSTFAFPR